MILETSTCPKTDGWESVDLSTWRGSVAGCSHDGVVSVGSCASYN